MDSTQPARWADGTLKDAEELDWVFSPSADIVALPEVSGEPPVTTSTDDQAIIEVPTVGRSLRRHVPSNKYIEAIAAERKDWMEDAEEMVVLKANGIKKRKADKTDMVSAQCMKKPKEPLENALIEVSQINEMSKNHADTSVPDSDDFSTSQTKVKKAELTADIFTVVKEITVGDQKGYRCQICITCRLELRNSNRSSYKKIQTDFFGNSTAIRKHICRNYKDHFLPYWSACTEKGLIYHDRYLSEEDRYHFTCIKNNEASDKIMSTQATLDGFVQTTSTWSKDELMEVILTFVIETNQLLSIVESDSFRHLLSYQRSVKANITDIPGRSKFTKLVEERAHDVQQDLKDQMTRASGWISLTFDGWTLKTMTSYIAVTCHFINEKWELVSHLLSFRELDSTHSGENQAHHLHEVVTQFNIDKKLMNITSDNVSVNDASLQILATILRRQDVKFNPKEQRSHCYSHVIALTTHAFANALSGGKLKECKARVKEVDEEYDEDEDVDALMLVLDAAVESDQGITKEWKVIAKLLTKVCAFVTKVHRSPSVKEYFRSCVSMTPTLDERTKTLELVAYCATRWETWEGVIERMLALQKPVNYFISTADDSCEVPQVSRGQARYESFKFTEHEWTLLSRILTVLKLSMRLHPIEMQPKSSGSAKVKVQGEEGGAISMEKGGNDKNDEGDDEGPAQLEATCLRLEEHARTYLAAQAHEVIIPSYTAWFEVQSRAISTHALPISSFG